MLIPIYPKQKGKEKTPLVFFMLLSVGWCMVPILEFTLGTDIYGYFYLTHRWTLIKPYFLQSTRHQVSLESIYI